MHTSHYSHVQYSKISMNGGHCLAHCLWLLTLLPFVMKYFNLDFKKDHPSLRASSNWKEQGLSAFGGNRHLASQLMMVMKTFIIVLKVMAMITKMMMVVMMSKLVCLPSEI